MKALLALVCLLSMSSVFAQYSTDLSSGDLNLSQAHAEIIKTAKICPATEDGSSCMAYGTVVSVKISMNGCIDRLGGYFSRFEEVNGKGILHFGAINIFNKTSMVARCVRIPSETVTMSVPFEGEIELMEMPFTGTKAAASN